MRRRGFTIVEVLVALTLVAIQLPMVIATVTTAANLTRRAQVIVTSIDASTAADRCVAP
jgi:prepilin-type N-terminal cleavage/methylation domain-containing protein